ncbi:probable cysteine--tRNA ligase, mitochondrial [Uranotaenia lowii]|uniref:probable cysteine--tRNA ligase, mitochondrial n=1 Tax=Uranotaenia lowii TaxID=190385 RepID=UPI002479A3DC|nr:probable cysteine--tRNA ligase, mitochondrial [Uranotaenia lowii]XP_055599270.1 probable cysteine--tRNA ligase, mitochondrial [Uranotaenia lowii]
MFTKLRHIRQISTKIPLDPSKISIYSCKTRGKASLNLVNPWTSTFYTCGPTVYDSAHIGHASCYVRLDIVQRILRDHFRLNLVTAMNITDIDDKIIKRAAQLGKTWEQISQQYEEEFWSDLDRLNVLRPDIKLRVTDHMTDIIGFINTLIEKGFAYKSVNESVYFRTAKYPTYGKLQNIPEHPKSSGGAKENTSDFALWKAAKPKEPFWEAPFGPGRPGWHIECSSLATRLFGSRIDFHAGGLDLRFPHHENEEAQSCCYHSVSDWVTHWLHTGQLHLDGQVEKMSKSLKNTISIGELLEKFTADEFRMLCLLSHYRSSIVYGDESMAVATNTLKKFHSFMDDSRAYVSGAKKVVPLDVNQIQEKLEEVDSKINEYLSNDFNTANVISALGELTSSINKMINQKGNDLIVASEVGPIQSVANYVRSKFDLLGLVSFGPSKNASTSEESHQSLEKLIESVLQIRGSIRGQAMETKNRQLFGLCDEIRDQLRQANVEIKDHGKTYSWSFLKR